MIDVHELLRPELDERIVNSMHFTGGNRIDFSVHFLARPGLVIGNEIFVEVRKSSDNLVLIGGNPLHLEVIYGFGWLATVDLRTGEKQNTYLSVDDQLTIEP